MKKFIALASISLGMLFTFALVNADDEVRKTEVITSTTHQPGTSDLNSPDTSTMDQQPGTMDTKTMNSNTMNQQNPGSMESSPSNMDQTKTQSTKIETTNTSMSHAKSCTDENGVTYRQNETGFKTCLESSKKHPNQMGGQVGSSESSSDFDAMSSNDSKNN